MAIISGHGLKTLDAVVDTATVDRDDQPRPSRRPKRRCAFTSWWRRRERHRATAQPAARARGGCRRGPGRGGAPCARRSSPSTSCTRGSPRGSSTTTGALRRFVNVFVADEDVRFLDGLDTSAGAWPDRLARPGGRRGLTAVSTLGTETANIALHQKGASH